MVHPHRRGPWVPEEDQLLIQLVRDQGPNNWVRISQHMHHRSAKQCRQRFHQNLKPSLNREPISADEGLIIERMVNEMGKRWADIARKLGNRSDNAVKNWWNGSMYRKQRGLPSSTTTTPFSRTSYSGHVEAPYPRDSVLSSSINQFNFFPSSLSWYGSQASKVSTTDRRRQQYSAASSVEGPSQLSPIFTLPPIICPFDTTLASPGSSESSNLPSTVSDNNSVSSAFPRTVSSDMRIKYGNLCRPSASDLDIPGCFYFTTGCQGSKAVDSISNFVLKPRFLPDIPTRRRHNVLLSQSCIMSPEENHTQRLKIEIPERDSRLGLYNLLH